MNDTEGGSLTPPVGPSDHVQGNANAPVTLVEYGDYQCPACGMAYPVIKDVQRELGANLRFVFRNFPLKESHQYAEVAAEAAEAVAAEGGEKEFWAMHDMLYENQDALDSQDLLSYAGDVGANVSAVARDLETGKFAARIRDDFRNGIRSGVNGTPTFFVNGNRFDGDWSDAQSFADALRSTAGD